MKFNPALLPEIDAVDVVKLKGIHAGNVDAYMQGVVEAPHVLVMDELAQQIADLWRRLPSGAQARCHTPPYGLRFYRCGELQFQASICWQCNNIFGDAKGEQVFFAFNGHSEPSRRLLSLCKQVFATREES
ncbi:MAG TPA: hypothetical protein VD835_13355 [Pyrinomonadaceae bacterium]|nr:hypothetical protein [Pyrinomonadaceae bacterium]